MKKLVFATNNQHKLQELRQIADGHFEVLSLEQIGCHDDIPETGSTFAENALQKARHIYQKYHLDCIADDSGLVVDALDGAPGVFSARFAARELGLDHTDSGENVKLLLKKLQGVADRSAHFSTVMALIVDGQEHTFEGRVDGSITAEPMGDGGFGYDPVFRPDGWDLTFAQASAQAKNEISHRARATRKAVDFLKTL